MNATVVAALTAAAAASAVALLVPAPTRLPSPVDESGAGPGRPPLLVALGAVATFLWLPSGTWVPALVAGVAALGGHRLWVRRREQRDAVLTGRRVLDACEQLAAELVAGQPPGAALSRAAEEWAALAPVAEAFRVGSDVPAALRAVSGRPGAGDLRLLAAAWQVAHRTGQGLAAAVDRVSRELVASRATRRVVDGELASARATARLVAALPVAALAMGSGVGGDPVGFLLHSPLGWACLAAGSAFGLLGLGWIEALARDVDRLG